MVLPQEMGALPVGSYIKYDTHHLRLYHTQYPSVNDVRSIMSSNTAWMCITLCVLQEVAAKVPQEEGTLPGGWPGIYGTDHLNLLAVYRQTLQGALHRLNGDLTQAVVCTPTSHPPIPSSALFPRAFLFPHHECRNVH